MDQRDLMQIRVQIMLQIFRSGVELLVPFRKNDYLSTQNIHHHITTHLDNKNLLKIHKIYESSDTIELICIVNTINIIIVSENMSDLKFDTENYLKKCIIVRIQIIKNKIISHRLRSFKMQYYTSNNMNNMLKPGLLKPGLLKYIKQHKKSLYYKSNTLL